MKPAGAKSMKATKYSVLAALLLVILAAPSTVRADSIVAVTISNLTFNTFQSCCGTQTLDAVFLWDNTSNSYVAGSLLFSSFGPLGSSFTFTPLQNFGFFNGPSFSLNTASSNPVAASIFFAMISASPNLLSTGTYSLTTNLLSSQPGTVFTNLGCANLACTSTTGFFGTQSNGVFLFKGAFPSGGSVYVFALPEPSSAALLGAGLLCLMMGLPLLRRRPI